MRHWFEPSANSEMKPEAIGRAVFCRPFLPRGKAVIAFLNCLGMLAGGTAVSAHAEDMEERMPPPPALGFPVGEILRYRIHWGIVPVGACQVSTFWTELDGRRVLRIRVRTKSNRVIASVYPVDDVLETDVDPQTFLPLRFVKNLSEGKHRYHEVTVFDHAEGVARWASLITGRKKIIPIEPETRDILSFMYWRRQRPLDSGTTEQTRVMADNKIYDLWLTIGGIESVKLPAFGRVPSQRIEPDAAFQGLFVRKGRITLWTSADERRVLTRLVGAVPVAKIEAVLCDVRGPGEDTWTRLSRERPETDLEPDDGAPSLP